MCAMYACIGGHYSFLWNDFLWDSVVIRVGVRGECEGGFDQVSGITKNEVWENRTCLFEVSSLIVDGH